MATITAGHAWTTDSQERGGVVDQPQQAEGQLQEYPQQEELPEVHQTKVNHASSSVATPGTQGEAVVRNNHHPTKRNVLLLGLDEAGKTRLSLLLSRGGALVEDSLSLFIRPTATLSGACLKVALHEGKTSTSTGGGGLASSESTGVGAAAEIHESYFFPEEEEAEWDDSNNARNIAEFAGPIQSNHIFLQDCSGAARFRYKWRQYYAQDWLSNATTRGLNSSRSNEERRFCHGIIFVINAHDPLRIPLAWSELCTVVQDLQSLALEHSRGSNSTVHGTAHSLSSLSAPCPVLVLVTQHHHHVQAAAAASGEMDRGAPVAGGGGGSSASAGGAGGTSTPLTAAGVLKMVEDHRPFPQGSQVTVANADLSHPAGARNSCRGVARWCQKLESTVFVEANTKREPL